jgi:hypothetical protein
MLVLLLLGVALVGLGLYRRRVATTYRDTSAKKQGHI